MAFIDWLREQHRASEANRSEFNDPRLNPFQQTAHGFSARNYGSRANMPSPLAAGEEIRPRLQVPSPTTPSPIIDAIRTRERINRFAPVVGTSPYGRDIRGGASRIPSFQEEGLFRDPVSSGLPGVSAMGGDLPPEGMWDMIVSFIMDRGKDVKKGGKKAKRKIMTRQERNRIRRLMEKTEDPYYPTGGRY
jgi:hypothetical protein